MQTLLSCLALSLLTFASAAQTNSPLVQFGEQYAFHSKILDEDRPYWVYLPPSCHSNSNHSPQKYPVLYLLDGEWNFQWASEVVQFMGDSLQIPELIVVGVPNIDTDRDLTPTHDTDNASGGGGQSFETLCRVLNNAEFNGVIPLKSKESLLFYPWNSALSYLERRRVNL